MIKTKQMKKLTLIVVCLLTTLFSYSQDFNRVLKATKLEFRNDQWVIVDTQYPTDYFVIIKDWDVTFGTYKLKTYNTPDKTTYEDHITYSWKCVNGEGDKGVFMIKKFRPEITNHILYSVVYAQYSLMYEYECE